MIDKSSIINTNDIICKELLLNLDEDPYNPNTIKRLHKKIEELENKILDQQQKFQRREFELYHEFDKKISKWIFRYLEMKLQMENYKNFYQQGKNLWQYDCKNLHKLIQDILKKIKEKDEQYLCILQDLDRETHILVNTSHKYSNRSLLKKRTDTNKSNNSELMSNSDYGVGNETTHKNTLNSQNNSEKDIAFNNFVNDSTERDTKLKLPQSNPKKLSKFLDLNGMVNIQNTLKFDQLFSCNNSNYDIELKSEPYNNDLNYLLSPRNMINISANPKMILDISQNRKHKDKSIASESERTSMSGTVNTQASTISNNVSLTTLIHNFQMKIQKYILETNQRIANQQIKFDDEINNTLKRVQLLMKNIDNPTTTTPMTTAGEAISTKCNDNNTNNQDEYFIKNRKFSIDAKVTRESNDYNDNDNKNLNIDDTQNQIHSDSETMNIKSLNKGQQHISSMKNEHLSKLSSVYYNDSPSINRKSNKVKHSKPLNKPNDIYYQDDMMMMNMQHQQHQQEQEILHNDKSCNKTHTDDKNISMFMNKFLGLAPGTLGDLDVNKLFKDLKNSLSLSEREAILCTLLNAQNDYLTDEHELKLQDLLSISSSNSKNISSSLSLGNLVPSCLMNKNQTQQHQHQQHSHSHSHTLFKVMNDGKEITPIKANNANDYQHSKILTSNIKDTLKLDDTIKDIDNTNSHQPQQNLNSMLLLDSKIMQSESYNNTNYKQPQHQQHISSSNLQLFTPANDHYHKDQLSKFIFGGTFSNGQGIGVLGEEEINNNNGINNLNLSINPPTNNNNNNNNYSFFKNISPIQPRDSITISKKIDFCNEQLLMTNSKNSFSLTNDKLNIKDNHINMNKSNMTTSMQLNENNSKSSKGSNNNAFRKIIKDKELISLTERAILFSNSNNNNSFNSNANGANISNNNSVSMIMQSDTINKQAPIGNSLRIKDNTNNNIGNNLKKINTQRK